jgi:penicillin-binding protein 1A
MPAMPGLEYLSGLHVRDAGLKPGFREGLGRFSTTVWLTRSWTKTEFLTTLADRGEFGAGVRGVEAGSRHYFGRTAGELTLPQAAMLAALAGDRRVHDPWCDPAGAAFRRGRILQEMRDNVVIDDAALQSASTSELGLGPAPRDHRPCPD